MLKFALGFICGYFLVLILRTPICTYFNFWITLFKSDLEKENRMKFCRKLVLERKLSLIAEIIYKNGLVKELAKDIEFVRNQLWRL
jgi:hypothetical protein